MDWNTVKNKIEDFITDDYVFADVFISLVEKYDKVEDNESLRLFALKMLKELMQSNTIFIHIVSETSLKKIEYASAEDIDRILNYIDTEWSKIDYRLPLPNQLFWISSE
jgi:hypothetical protein